MLNGVVRGEVLADGDKRFPLIAHQVGLGFDLLLETLRTPKGAPLLGNTLAELCRAMAGMQLTAGQIRDIDSA